MPCPRRIHFSWDFLLATATVLNILQEKHMNFNIQLTAEQIAYIGRCLGEKPYHEVVAIISSIQTQVDQQIAAAQSAPAALEPATKSKK